MRLIIDRALKLDLRVSLLEPPNFGGKWGVFRAMTSNSVTVPLQLKPTKARSRSSAGQADHEERSRWQTGAWRDICKGKKKKREWR